MLEYSTAACAVPAHVPGTETPPCPGIVTGRGAAAGSRELRGAGAALWGAGIPAGMEGAGFSPSHPGLQRR